MRHFEHFYFNLAIGPSRRPTPSDAAVPISRGAVALIRPRGDAVPKGCSFLFPGDVSCRPVFDLMRFWERMRTKADIPDVRIRGLRHTFASLLVSDDASLEIVGRQFGHAQIGANQRCALIYSPLQAGVATVDGN